MASAGDSAASHTRYIVGNCVFIGCTLAAERAPGVSARFPPPVPASSSPEERVIRTHRLYKNWDLAALPVTVRTSRGDTVAPRVTRRQFEQQIQAPTPVAAPPIGIPPPSRSTHSGADFVSDPNPASKCRSFRGYSLPSPSSAPASYPAPNRIQLLNKASSVGQ
ncbi:hypothetical protein OPQ81_002974 [Rhizoctonia solani]|nr:hypothetical protein OPQ81_002974 [Rhizoctonia solani]